MRQSLFVEMKLRKFIRKVSTSLRYRWLDLRLPRLGTGSPKLALPDIEGTWPSGKDDSLLFFTVADSVYLDRYGRSFMASLLMSHAKMPALHIHVYNPSPDQLGLLNRLVTYSTLKLSYTWEQVDLQHLDKERKVRYYYSVRFVRLAQVFEKTARPCLCLDIDTLMVGKPSKLLERVVGADVCFYARFKKFGVNTKLLAGTLYVANTKSAHSLTVAVGQQIQRFVEQGLLLEKLDQLVIYDMFVRHRRKSDLAFCPFENKIIDLDFTEHGLIWYPKGNSKENLLYRRKKQWYEKEFEKIINEVV